MSSADVEMKGGGYYSQATRGAKDVIDGVTPLVLAAIDRMPLSERPFVLADLGAADGGTSLDLVAAVADHVDPRELAVIYTDQPRNDYNALFRIVHGLTALPSPLADRERLRVLASATSFYRQVLPTGSLDLAFSATAMQWLSAKPVDLPDAVHSVRATGSEHAAFAAQARSDWEAILSHRAAELVPGGRFVSITFGIDEQGRFLGNTGGVSMHDTFHALWVELADEGVITRAEQLRMTLPQYYRTVEEFTGPLEDPAGGPYRAGLRLEDVATAVVPCPFATAFAEHRDAARFAREYVPTLRSWTEGTFAAALDATRQVVERTAIMDAYYGRYEQRVRDAPAGHGMSYVHVHLVAAKVSRPSA